MKRPGARHYVEKGYKLEVSMGVPNPGDGRLKRLWKRGWMVGVTGNRRHKETVAC